VPRKNKTNGNKFFGCAEYPRCQHTMTTEVYKRRHHEEGCSMVGEHPYDDEYDMGQF